MSTWYYYNEQGEKIETTGGRLKGLAKAGMITPETIVENEEGKKARAGKVRGLTFAISVPSETTPPLESESYGLAQPPKPSVATNPFTAPKPQSTSPFATPVSEAVNPFVAPQEYENPFTEPFQAISQSMSASVEGESKSSVWVTFVGILIVLLVGTIGWLIVDKFDKRSAEANNRSAVNVTIPEKEHPPTVKENRVETVTPVSNRPPVVNVERTAPSNPGNNRPSVDNDEWIPSFNEIVEIQWMAAHLTMLMAHNEFVEAIAKDILMNDENELIKIISEIKLADFSLCSCSDSFKAAHKELVDRMTDLAVLRSVWANAKRRGDNTNYIVHSEEKYRQSVQPFNNARTKFWDLLDKENKRIERETKEK